MIEKEHIEKEYVDIVNVFKECGVDIFVLKHFQNWDLLIKQLKMQEKTDLL